jgi:hypothetical protein
LLEAGGLAAALRAAAATLGVRVRVRVPADGEWPPEVAGTVYFCCLDLLDQVPPDVEATITIRAEDGVLAFDFATVGSEIPDEIRDRIEALGGSMRLNGTSVSGSLPLSR